MKKLSILLLGILLISFSSAQLARNMTAYWNFNEGQGARANSSINFVNNLTVNNTYWVADGLRGNALNINNISTSMSNVSTAVNLSGSKAMSMNWWYRRTGTVLDFSMMFTKQSTNAGPVGNGEFRFEVEPNNNSAMGLDIMDDVTRSIISNNSANTNFTLGNWYMLTLTLNSTSANYYINGVPTFNKSLTNFIVNGTRLILWSSNDGTNILRNSTFDEMGVWNKTLNTSEINRLYNNGAGISSPFNFETTLTAPQNNFIGINKTYTASFTTFGFANITNATLFYWYSNGSLFNQSSVFNVSTTNNQTAITIGGIPRSNFLWNILGCGTNATGTTCNFAPSNYSYTYAFNKNSLRFNTPVLEGSVQTFSFNLSLDNSNQLNNASLLYDGVGPYSSSIVQETNVTYIIRNSISVPSVLASTNFTFNWTLGFTDGSSFSSDSNGQVVNDIQIDSCTSQTGLLVNYSVFDEDNLFPLTGTNNVTIESLLILYPTGSTNGISFNKTYFAVNTTNPAQICFNSSVLSSGNFTMDLTARYYASQYNPEYFNIQNRSVTSLTIPYLFNLYDLLTTSAQQFQITFRDNNFLPVQDAIIDIQRQYLGGAGFLSVESPKTDGEGKTIGNFVLNDVVYNINITKNGILLATFLNKRAFCDNVQTGDCVIDLNQRAGTIHISPSRQFSGVSFSPSYNSSTKTYSVDFSVLDQSIKTISINISNYGSSLNNSICTNSISASSGTLTCIIPSQYSNNTALAKTFIDGDLASSEIFAVGNIDRTTYGVWRYALAFGLILTLGAAAMSSKIGILINLIIGLILAVALNLLDAGGMFGTTSALIWLVVVAGILAAKWNKENG